MCIPPWVPYSDTQTYDNGLSIQAYDNVMEKYFELIRIEPNDTEGLLEFLKIFTKENIDFLTLLHHVAITGNLEAVKALVKKGADVNLVGKNTRLTPLLALLLLGRQDSTVDDAKEKTDEIGTFLVNKGADLEHTARFFQKNKTFSLMEHITEKGYEKLRGAILEQSKIKGLEIDKGKNNKRNIYKIEENDLGNKKLRQIKPQDLKNDSK